tara:strand:- start:1043 stop:2413 length:1371 start_codon:yes stop_codon:yes gene_type:complete
MDKSFTLAKIKMLTNLLNKLNDYKSDILLIDGDKRISYKDLLIRISKFEAFYKQNKIKNTDVILISSKLTIEFIALFIVLLKNNNVIIPIEEASKINCTEIYNITKYDLLIKVREENVSISINDIASKHNLIHEIHKRNVPGIILFTSGTSGAPKAILHDAGKLLNLYKVEGRRYRTFLFMSHDHIGGLNTLLYNLFNGGTLILNNTYNVDIILGEIEKHHVTLLPTTPSFLNMMLLTNSFNKYNLSSLRLITYGTEPMDKRTLTKLNESFPEIKLRQTYGMTEIGILNIKSRNSGSLEIKIDKEKNDYKVINDILYIKSDTSMIGYLNYKSPFTDDGWMNTGDRVFVNGEYITILGRESELINVGGEKVFPIEVETILKEYENVSDAVVYAKENRILGHIVAADIVLINKTKKENDFILSIKRYCTEKLENYKVPVKINLVNKIRISNRYKKVRI